jgi:hypothetical protein
VTHQSPEAQQHFSLYLMVGSWALVEVPRYLYLAANTALRSMDAQPPWILHFLRYNLFMLLYPSGITGEYLQVSRAPVCSSMLHLSDRRLQMLKALHNLHASASFGLWYYTVFLLVLYIPMGPYMIMNMNGQRLKANKNRAEALLTSPKLEAGILFPLDKSGINRTTSPAGQSAFAATFQAIGEDRSAQACFRGPWRFSYSRHLLQHVKSSLKSRDNAIKMAEAGISFIYDHFEFGPSTEVGGKIEIQPPIPLRKALESTKQAFRTFVVEGSRKQLPRKVTVPYAKYPRTDQLLLEGEDLKMKLQSWAQRGTIERDTADSLCWAVDNQATLDLRSHWSFSLASAVFRTVDNPCSLHLQVCAARCRRCHGPPAHPPLPWRQRRRCRCQKFQSQRRDSLTMVAEERRWHLEQGTRQSRSGP